MDNEINSEISNKSLAKMLNKSIGYLLSDFMKIALSDFSSAKSIVKIALKQKNTEAVRNKCEEAGIHVPPFMIASITSTCNLKCKGCYDREKKHNCALELNEEEWADIFSEARDLGMSFILLAGGEPLTKDKVIKKCINFPEIIFPVFTNGLLINEDLVQYFTSCRNLIPILSIEGDRNQTDDRRGEGVFEKVSSSMDLLKKHKIFYGTSTTVTSQNYDNVINDEYIKTYIDKGCRVFLFIEYVPFDKTTENLVITDNQKKQLDARLDKLREKYKAIFIVFPGDEKQFGGCLAAGRGFIHINSAGGVEPCPFSPYSDISLKNVSLKEALESPLLNEIRNLHGLLKEHEGGCALFENKDMVEKIVEKISHKTKDI